MRRIRIVLVLVALVVGCGTVTSLEPLSDSSDLVFEPALLGAWTDDSAETQFIVTPAEANRYLIAMADAEGKTGRFVGALTRLNGRLVLDITPEPLAVHVSDLYRDLLRPLHTFLFLDIVGEQLRVSIPHPDSVRSQLRLAPNLIAHTNARDKLLLTASTRDLRAYLSAFALRPGVIDTVGYWRRPR